MFLALLVLLVRVTLSLPVVLLFGLPFWALFDFTDADEGGQRARHCS